MVNQSWIKIIVAAGVLFAALLSFQNCSQRLGIKVISSGTTELPSLDPLQKFDQPVVSIATATQVYSQRSFEIPFLVKLDPQLELQSKDCTIQGHSDVDCVSDRVSVRNLPDGQHTLRLKIKDSQNQVSNELIYHFVVDATAPTISILSQPLGFRKERSAEFSIRVIDTQSPITQVECALNNSAFVNCTTFTSHSLTGLIDGSYFLKIRAKDSLGNQSEVTSQVWQIDTVAPTLSFSKQPNTFTNVTQQSIEFSAAHPDGGPIDVKCKVNSGAFAACSSPLIVNSSADGLQTVQVTATDQAGNTASQNIQWTLDRVKPTISFTATPGSRSALQSFRFEFNAADSSSGTGSVQCSFNNAAFTVCNSLSHHLVNWSGQGPMSFAVRAFDGAGNASNDVIHNWVVDLSAPTITVVSRPAPITKFAAATFQLSITDNGNTNLTNTCQHNTNVVFSCTNSFSITATEGENRLKIVSVDDQNNRSEVTVVWVLDSTSPQMTYLKSSAPPDINITEISIEFLATDATALTYECVVNNAGLPAKTLSNCTSGLVISNLVSGSLTISVKATDVAGNVSAPLQLNRNVDLVVPAITNFAFSELSPTNKDSISATFTANDSGSGIFQIKCSLTKPNQTPVESKCTSPFVISGFLEGELKLEVWAIDKAGNQSVALAKNIFIDRTKPNAPTLAIEGAPLRTDRNVSFTLLATDTSGAPSYFCQIVGQDASESACTSPYSRTISNDGAFEIKVRAKDLAGNYSEYATLSFTIDKTAPLLPTLTTTSSNPTGVASATFSFTSADNISGVSYFVCEFNGQLTSPCASPHPVNLVAGLNRFRVKAVNRVGLESSFQFLDIFLDQSPPSVPSVSLNPDSTNGELKFKAVFSSVDSGSGISHYECSLNSEPFKVCTSPHTFTLTDYVDTSFRVKAFDKVGNESGIAQVTADPNSCDFIQPGPATADSKYHLSGHSIKVGDFIYVVRNYYTSDAGTWGAISKYDVKARRWTSLKNPSVNLFNPKAALLNNDRIFVLSEGNCFPSTCGARQAIVYDINSDRWETVPDVPVGVYTPPYPNDSPKSLPFDLATDGTRVFIWGGDKNAFQSMSGFYYNDSSKTWKIMSMVNAPDSRRAFFSIHWTGTKLLIWSGFDTALCCGFDYYSANPSKKLLSDGALYDPNTDTWQAIPAPIGNTGRAYHASVWTGQEMVIIGGINTTGGRCNITGFPNVCTPDTIAFNPVTMSWRQLKNLPQESLFFPSADIFDRRIIVADGFKAFDHSPSLPSVPNRKYFVYDLQSDSWTQGNIKPEMCLSNKLGHSGNTTYTKVRFNGVFANSNRSFTIFGYFKYFSSYSANMSGVQHQTMD